jgi:ABC-type antimicrobial peptide transport system permease subunit
LITRAIATIPWEVGISDRGSLGMTVALLGIIGLAACAIPLGRALRLHPATLLREG